MNWADSISPNARISLQTAEIKNKNDFSIRLCDKKLFFTSAKIAYTAKAKKFGVAGDEEGYIISLWKKKLQILILGIFYLTKHGRLWLHTDRVSTSLLFLNYIAFTEMNIKKKLK
jgi:hypothetical protein